MVAQGSLLPGSAFAGYRIVELVGRGGMGEVYRAVDERLDRPVALKVLAPALAGDERFRARMLRESRLAASLDHPNVIPVYDAGDCDGRLFIAMRFVEGTDLREVLRQGALEPQRAAVLGAQVAEALDAAHRRGLVHRDVKPSNVLIAREAGREHCYLADFGLTQSATEAGPVDGSMLGTIDYVAPEAIRGDPVDGRADQYALGCMLFECLTGSPPFASASDTATIYAHLEEPPPAASAHRPGLTASTDAVLARAMAKEPDERFASCGELVGGLGSALGIGVPVRPSRRTIVAAVVLAVAAVGAALAALLTRGGAAAPPAGALVRIDPGTNAVSGSVKLSRYPEQVAAGSGTVWVTAFRDGAIWFYTPRTRELQRASAVGDPRDVTLAGGKAYVSADGPTVTDGTVLRYDAVTGERESGVPLVTCSITSGAGLLWTAGCPLLERLSTGVARLRVITTVSVPRARVQTASNLRNEYIDLAIGAGSLWVLGDAADHRVWRLDARTGRLQATIELPFVARALTFGDGALWVTAQIDDVVGRIDPATNRLVQRIPVGRGASGIAAGAGAVWVADRIDRTVTRIDPASGRVTATIPVGGNAVDVAVGDGAVWVATDAP